ncbi:hypothetical protein E3P99_00567 [Wallemia hederae]|uniref:Thioredoxin domain-containing protein n=1 Tax=Wallemia hederae TaxID=1540922 RepID=A0A4T0FWG3_9BASI|nr:hypothetical protein E3P99_00567 [Wallemia hederae]
MKQPIRLGSIAPNFKAKSSHGELDLHSYMDSSWTILFSHPDDFTPVCTTEIGALSCIHHEFSQRGVKLLGLSINDEASHHGWISDINELYNTSVTFPIIADCDRKVATLYDMLDFLDETNVDSKGDQLTVRSLFIIDPAKRIRLILSYPASTGRNWNEVLRTVDSLQLGDMHTVTTPANWNKGDSVIVHPTVTDEQAVHKFGDVDFKKPYLRMTRDPTTRESNQ